MEGLLVNGFESVQIYRQISEQREEVTILGGDYDGRFREILLLKEVYVRVNDIQNRC